MGESGVQKEQYHEGLQAEHTALIATAFSLTATLVLSLVVWVLLKRKVKLGVVIMAGVEVAVVTVGMVAWVITYQEMRKAIEEQVDALLISRGSEAELALKSVLDIGPVINDVHRELLSVGETALLHPFPAPLRYLSALSRASLRTGHRGVDLLYYGTNDNFMYGIYESESPKMMYTVPEGSTIPEVFVCRGANGSVSNQACYGERGKGRLMIYEPRSVDDPLPRGTVLHSLDYVPTSRPWYKLHEDMEWAEPYPSGTEYDFAEYYLTVTRALRHPTTGDWMGVAAVDYTVQSLAPLLVDLPPTTNSVLLLATTDGKLISTNLDPSLILPPKGQRHTVQLVWESVTPLREPVAAILRRHGTLEAAYKAGKAVIQEDETAILLQPVAVEGGLDMVVVIAVPYDDVLGTSNDASTTALLLVLVISIALCVCIAMLVTAIVAPLGKLAEDMDKVAWMRVEEVPARRMGIASELSWMNESFRLMVVNLREYKQYLPQSILAETDEESADDGKASDDRSDKATNSGSNDAARFRTVFSNDTQIKTVTMACVALHGLDGLTKEAFHSAYTTFIEVLLSASRSHKGVIDNVAAERVFLSFNAVHTTSSHRAKGTECALRVLREHRHLSTQRSTTSPPTPSLSPPPCTTVTIGVCSGEVRCGNTGCTGLKKFNCFGGVVSTACYFAQLAPEWEAGVVLDHITHSHIGELFVVRAVPQLVWLEHGRKAGMPYEVLELRTDRNVEWMYTIGGSNAMAMYNTAVARMCAGDYDGSLRILDCCTEGRAAALRDAVLVRREIGRVEPIVEPRVGLFPVNLSP